MGSSPRWAKNIFTIPCPMMSWDLTQLFKTHASSLKESIDGSAGGNMVEWEVMMLSGVSTPPPTRSLILDKLLQQPTKQG